MGNMRGVLLLLILNLLCVPAAAAQKPERKAKATKTTFTQSTARSLRAEWELADLKLTREAVDDTTFKPAVKSKAAEALETFIAQQEQLVAQVEQSPEAEAKARKQRAKMHAAFMQRMAVVYDDPKLKQELTTCVRAINREMDEMAESAGKLFSRLEQVGLTAEQKQKLKPVVEEGNKKVREAVEKSKTKSTKDQAVREEVVDKFKESRRKVKQHLTPEQRSKLKQTLAAE
jgi:hypothetical protein